LAQKTSKNTPEKNDKKNIANCMNPLLGGRETVFAHRQEGKKWGAIRRVPRGKVGRKTWRAERRSPSPIKNGSKKKPINLFETDVTKHQRHPETKPKNKGPGGLKGGTNADRTTGQPGVRKQQNHNVKLSRTIPHTGEGPWGYRVTCKRKRKKNLEDKRCLKVKNLPEETYNTEPSPRN